MQGRPKIDSRTLRQDAEGRWETIFSHLAPELNLAMERNGKHVPCPVNGGKDGFRLYKDWIETGGGVSNQEGSYSDGISLLMWLKGWNFPEALHAVAEVLGGNAGQQLHNTQARRQPRQPTQAEILERERKNAQLSNKLNRVWSESLHHSDEAALPMRHYLMNRGLFYYGLPETLRFHPALPYYDEEKQFRGTYPAMVAVVQNVDGKPISLHRTFLDDSQGKKALVDEPKKLMAYPTDRTLNGSAIRLGEIRSTLHIAEGIETALAVRQVIQQPVWSCISAGLLEAFHPPVEVKRVVVWADHDVSCRGIESAEKLASRLAKFGIAVEINLPDMPIPSKAKGIDWLDVLQVHGEEAIRKKFRQMIRVAA